MRDRKKTPDILGSLLGDTSKPEYHNAGIPVHHNDSMPELQPTSKTVRKSTGKPVSKPTSKPAGQKKAEAEDLGGETVSPPPSKPAGQKKAEAEEPAEKVKATFYLDAKTVEALEDGWIQLRKLADNRGRISKSLIVELALDMALKELEKRGSESSLYKRSQLSTVK